MRRTVSCVVALLVLITACGGDDDDTPESATTSSSSPSSSTTVSPPPAQAELAELWEPTCPDGHVPKSGINEGFRSDGVDRQYQVLLPDDLTTPRPVFVSLTGTVQTETAFLQQSGLERLVDDGWIVLAPVRLEQADGRVWPPWFDGHADPAEEGPDVRFVEAAVQCAATTWDVDQRAVYIGGISAGGSFTNRSLTFNSDFFAGGVPASGNWYPVEGGPEGLCCPRPLPTMESAVVIIIWGGPSDRWPDTATPLAIYGPETKLAAEYFAGQQDVVTVSCSGTHGHIWPTAMTTWLAATLLSHPKGSDPGDFELTDPPSGFTCVLGEYTDH